MIESSVTYKLARAIHARHPVAFCVQVLAFAWVCFVLSAAPSLAQTSDLRAGSLNPFPKDDIYRLHLMGDWMIDGLKPELRSSLNSMPRIRLQDTILELQSVRRSSWDKHVTSIRERARSTPIDMAVVMFGVSEIGSVFTPGRERQRFASEGWQRKYASRVDAIMKALKASKGAVYWVGLPIVRRRDHSEGFRMINTLVRERAYANGVNFIDVYSRFQDESGGFDRYGPDLDGTIKLLRARDGVYFTESGYAKIAQLVLQMIRRDINSVKADRVVTLAGSESEQGSIRRAREAAAVTPRRPGIQGAVAASRKKATGARASGLPGGTNLGAQKADDGIAVYQALVNSKPTKMKLKLPRPALSATVMMLVTRNQSKDKPARLGDNAVHVIDGGVPLLSTVTPANQTALALRKRRLSPTQSVFFKVWGKGERLDPRPGRADHYKWPRLEPKPVVHARAESGAASPRRQPPRDPNLPPLPEPNPFR